LVWGYAIDLAKPEEMAYKNYYRLIKQQVKINPHSDDGSDETHADISVLLRIG
jgi:hypothetical protein